MTVLVTGASGFLGTHVLRTLSKREAPVLALSRGPLREPVPAGIRHVEMDLASADRDTFAELGRPDTLIHLAWGGLPNYRSRHHFEDELPLHYAFLRTMVESGLKSLVVTGTCYEYGMRNGELVEAMHARPANAYGFAKTALHRQLDFLKTEHDFSLAWARLFYMWGEGQAENSIWPQLQAALARGDREFPMSGGEQLRDYLPVEEVARRISELAIAQTDVGAINICSGEPVSVRSLVERWVAASPATIALALGRFPYADHEPFAFWGSDAKWASRSGS